MLARAPNIDFALVVESKNVICASGNINDVLQLGNKNWCCLVLSLLCLWAEANDTIITLDVVSFAAIFENGDSLGTCPSHIPSR